ncbi:MAG: hypothetical protein DI623_00875 [Sphingomonas sanxanigenens]|uniref:Uncharacterized protein n=1 Tax=Sphingomonas sanxanigenens TaxID=397260 RepID=A0A2W5AG14_9SPHN|nr:MAG: hypothetical protein DI623_00875 [Sphingomonas sanxanigenens]
MSALTAIGTLAAIVGVAGMARLLGLGGGRIENESEAASIAARTIAGFAPERALLDHDGQAALIRGKSGELVALKMHGAMPAARQLTLPLTATIAGSAVRVPTGDARFGDVTFKCQDAEKARELARMLERSFDG